MRRLASEGGPERLDRKSRRGGKSAQPPKSYGFKFIIPSTEDQNEIMKSSRIASILILFVISTAYTENIYYKVAEKDTLWSIAREYDVKVDVLMEVNEIDDERSLRVGMELLIPSVYVVEKGDNLWRIAREHQTSVQVLRDLNDMLNDEIHVGEILMVPALGSSNPSSPSIESVETPITSVSVTAESDVDKLYTSSVSPFWPVEGVRSKKTGKISGTEILGSQGDAVVSIAGGEVVWNARSPVFGNVVIIESPGNYLYLYSGLTETNVTFGERIIAGAKIAELGVNPHTGEAKLLFSVYKDGELIDPSIAPRG